MKALVTGSAGFIGSHLVDLLLSKGIDVVGVDSLVTGRLANLKSALNSKNFRLEEYDIRKNNLNNLFEGVDWVFHLAGLADIVPSIENPVDYYSTNVSGTLNVLEASRRNGVKRFIYSASSSCYGLPSVYPTPENSLISPQYPYALTKYMGEELVLHWSKVYNLPAISLRLFNVYGQRSRTNGAYGAVFGVFLAQKLAKKPFTIVGDGEQTRDFTYVTDVVSAFFQAACSSVSGHAINVGSGHSLSINYLVSLLGGGEVVNLPKRPGEPDCTFADITKIKKLLNWNPQINFESGVVKMLEYIDDWKGAPVWESDSIEKATKTWFQYLER